jgi:hypothetical protein
MDLLYRRPGACAAPQKQETINVFLEQTDR